MRAHIIAEIKRIAPEKEGKPPGQELFTRLTGITRATWLGRHWARWGDALREAGFEPNAFQGKTPDDFLFTKLAEACRHYKRAPTSAELRMYRKIDPSFPTLENRFSTKVEMIACLRKWAINRSGFDDLIIASRA
jgi:hypothetical protein